MSSCSYDSKKEGREEKLQSNERPQSRHAPALSASKRHKLLTATNPIGSDFQKGVDGILVKVVKSEDMTLYTLI